MMIPSFKLQQECQKRVPIIGVTANISAATKKQCIKAGMDEVRNKPILLQDVQTLVNSYTE